MLNTTSNTLTSSASGQHLMLLAVLYCLLFSATFTMVTWFLNIPTSGLLPALPLFLIWFGAGTLSALVVTMFIRKRGWLTVFAGLVMMGLVLYLLSFSLGLGNANYGWGLYALPPSLAGFALVSAMNSKRQGQVLYVSAWIALVATLILPLYFNWLDGLEGSRAYATFNQAPEPAEAYVRAEITLTAVYLTGTTLLLILPLLLNPLRIFRRASRH